MSKLVAIVLAAGKGTRMKSQLAKVLHPIMGRPMLAYPLETLKNLGINQIIAVVGYQAEAVKAAFSDYPVTFVVQEPQLGTGHAVQVACQTLDRNQGSVLVVCGDVPLLPEAYLEALYHQHQQTGAAATVLTVELTDPGSYGRLVKDGQGNILKIVEARDATPEELSIREINTGIYCFQIPFLLNALEKLRPDNDQQELYLTDVIAQAQAQNLQVSSLKAPEAISFQGINTRVDLSIVSRRVCQQINERHMLAGVTLIDPEATYIEADVEIGPDTVIYPNCYLMGNTRLGSGCILEPNVKIVDSTLGTRVTIKMATVITESIIADEVQIGPFAHLRPLSEIRDKARIGNFVEVKKSLIHPGVKAGHLSYLGDAEIGPEVNIGAGTITCNYDGQKKHQTIIEAGVFIGSNSALVAPVRIGEGAYVGAGSTITADVPPGKLAIARGRQVIKEIKPK
ncbi:MAG: bifunctional UDP-N-acetylglucosamine diphosphorylase/glucosamine-1-phosphate N-acetyltransferase GlmU [Desulfobacca sp.]|nr:bifunctional UDP-N-acetylglucosamine diphosphorylase/glucosamine-1-phosphate N-acetyltransferase GlmU [Desulfobacca sp.]